MKYIGIGFIVLMILVLFFTIDSNFIEKEYVLSIPNTSLSIKVIRNSSKQTALVFFDDNDFIEIKMTKCIDIGTTYYIDTLEKRVICLEFFDKIKEINCNQWRIEKFEWRKKMMSYDSDKIHSTIINELNGNYLCVYASEHVLYWSYYDKKEQNTFELNLVEKRRKIKF